MRYLLDTHVWIWSVLADRRLSRRARTTLQGLSDEKVGIASISLKEASWHLVHGRVVISPETTWAAWLRDAAGTAQLDVLPLTVEVAIASERFSPRFPHDPADRIIAATAKVNGLTLMTADRALLKSPEVSTFW